MPRPSAFTALALTLLALPALGPSASTASTQGWGTLDGFSGACALREMWHVGAVGADKAWALGYNGSGVVVALLDSGVNPEVVGDRLLAWAEVSDGRVEVCGSPRDDLGHGSKVASILLSVAPGVGLVVVRVLEGGFAEPSDVAVALEWLASPVACNGLEEISVDVVLLPFSIKEYWDERVARAIARLIEDGVVVVAAAGNWGPGVVGFPASLWGVIAVGALTRDLYPAGFSGGGVIDPGLLPEWWPVSRPRTPYVKPDLAAPGVSVPAPGLGELTGTSAAAPIVAGVAALVLDAAKSEGLDLGPAELAEVLYSTSRDLWEDGLDDRTGHGIPNAFYAIQRVLEAAGAPKVVVRDGFTGEPVAWAEVVVDGEPLPTLSGQISLPTRKVGTDVLVRAWGYRDARVTIEYNITVTRLERLPHGYVVLDVAGDVDGVLTLKVEGGPLLASAKTEGQLVAWLPVGTHLLVLEADGYKPEAVIVNIREGGVVVKQVRLDPAFKIALVGFIDDIAVARLRDAIRGAVVEVYDIVEELEGNAYDLVVVGRTPAIGDPETLAGVLSNVTNRVILAVTGSSGSAPDKLLELLTGSRIVFTEGPIQLPAHPAFASVGEVLQGIRSLPVIDVSGGVRTIVSINGKIVVGSVKYGGTEFIFAPQEVLESGSVLADLTAALLGDAGYFGAPLVRALGGSVYVALNADRACTLLDPIADKQYSVSLDLVGVNDGMAIVKVTVSGPPGYALVAIRDCSGVVAWWAILWIYPSTIFYAANKSGYSIIVEGLGPGEYIIRFMGFNSRVKELVEVGQCGLGSSTPAALWLPGLLGYLEIVSASTGKPVLAEVVGGLSGGRGQLVSYR